MATGRPKCRRITGSGEKLRRALALNNLTWGGHTASRSHISHNAKWRELSLPRSYNTLLADIVDGIPENRIVHYANFFGIDPNLFLDSRINAQSQTFEANILNSTRDNLSSGFLAWIKNDEKIYNSIFSQSASSYTESDLANMSGVYNCYLMHDDDDLIHKSVMLIHSFHNKLILGSAFASYGDVKLFINVVFYRVVNFICATFFIEKNPFAAYAMAPDPLSSPLTMLESVFSIKLAGITGGLISTYKPSRFSLLAIRDEQLGIDPEKFDEIGSNVAASPPIKPDDPDYEEIKGKLRLIG